MLIAYTKYKVQFLSFLNTFKDDIDTYLKTDNKEESIRGYSYKHYALLKYLMAFDLCVIINERILETNSDNSPKYTFNEIIKELDLLKQSANFKNVGINLNSILELFQPNDPELYRIHGTTVPYRDTINCFCKIKNIVPPINKTYIQTIPPITTPETFDIRIGYLKPIELQGGGYSLTHPTIDEIIYQDSSFVTQQVIIANNATTVTKNWTEYINADQFAFPFIACPLNKDIVDIIERVNGTPIGIVTDDYQEYTTTNYRWFVKKLACNVEIKGFDVNIIF